MWNALAAVLHLTKFFVRVHSFIKNCMKNGYVLTHTKFKNFVVVHGKICRDVKFKKNYKMKNLLNECLSINLKLK